MKSTNERRIAYDLGKTVGRAEGINECLGLLAKFIPAERRAEASMVVMVAALSVAGEALGDGEREAAS